MCSDVYSESVKEMLLFREFPALKIFSALAAVSLALVLFGVLGSCSLGGRGAGLKRHDLFSISLGTLPGELDWFYRDGFRIAGTADIQERDGLIYISGGNAGKVMVFNSYGDLVTYVYDPARNPAPASGEEGTGVGSVSSWPFRDIGHIAAYGGGFLVEDGVEKERRVEEGEFGALYDRVVLRFDRDGEYQGHLGKEGLGGSPFPYIDSLEVRKDGGIVVTCRVPGAWMSYWFDQNGRPVSTVRIEHDRLPGLKTGETAAVYSVRPDPVEWALHIRMDVYRDEDGAREPEARLYTLNLSTLEYSEPLVLSYTSPLEETGIPSVPLEYLGTAASGAHLLLSTEGPEIYRLILMDPRGRIVQNRRLKVEASATIYRRFRLQPDGLLTGIFFGPEKASVAWWRVDKLLKNVK